MTVEEKIISHIEQNCTYPDGSPMMDEQTFYEGAKCGYNEAMKEVKEMKANAQLIAAAPDLLEALMIINGDIGRTPNPYTLQEKIEIVEKAINKALGK